MLLERMETNDADDNDNDDEDLRAGAVATKLSTKWYRSGRTKQHAR